VIKAPRDHSLTGLRGVGYVIDGIAGAVISFGLTWLPVGGAPVSSVVLVAWWLLRDLPGASLGKRLLGLKVVRQDGSPSDVRARLLRNLTLIPGPLFSLIPIAGFTGPAVSLSLVLVEVGFLVIRHERLGDRLAGTMVVRK
jgi:uncharacterized RDD family membrane protein YckC